MSIHREGEGLILGLVPAWVLVHWHNVGVPTQPSPTPPRCAFQLPDLPGACVLGRACTGRISLVRPNTMKIPLSKIEIERFWDRVFLSMASTTDYITQNLHNILNIHPTDPLSVAHFPKINCTVKISPPAKQLEPSDACNWAMIHPGWGQESPSVLSLFYLHKWPQM